MFKHIALLVVFMVAAVPAFAEVTTQVSPDGHSIEIYVDDVDFEAWINSIPEGGSVTGCLNSTSSGGINWFWTVDAFRDGPGFTVTGGFIEGTICDSPNWAVRGGFISKTSLQLNADYVGGGSCAAEVDMSGTRSGGPRIWSGLYGFPAHAFPHDTEFLGMFPCP